MLSFFLSGGANSAARPPLSGIAYSASLKTNKLTYLYISMVMLDLERAVMDQLRNADDLREDRGSS